jgi:hypothetical protein
LHSTESLFDNVAVEGVKEMHQLNRVLLICVFALVAQAGTIVVPNFLSSAEGNSNNEQPFRDAQRFQQVYAASQFSGNGVITQIAFRPDVTFGNAFSMTIANLQIDLSTTSANPDGLSDVFANNVGADDLVVYAGPFSVATSFSGPAAGPKAFDIVINLTTPFFYNPSLGNLLLDVRNFSGASLITCPPQFQSCTSVLDAQAGFGDSVSRAWSATGGLGNPTVFNKDTWGVVTQFTIVPGPGTFATVAIVLLWLVGWNFHRVCRSIAYHQALEVRPSAGFCLFAWWMQNVTVLLAVPQAWNRTEVRPAIMPAPSTRDDLAVADTAAE